MLNQIILVGRLVSDPEIKETKSGKKVGTITLAVSRSYKNSNRIYETDFVPVALWNGIAENTAEYCKKGDMVGIKGKIESSTTADDWQTIDENKKMKLRVIAEKVTFLSSKKS